MLGSSSLHIVIIHCDPSLILVMYFVFPKDNCKSSLSATSDSLLIFIILEFNGHVIYKSVNIHLFKFGTKPELIFVLSSSLLFFHTLISFPRHRLKRAGQSVVLILHWIYFVICCTFLKLNLFHQINWIYLNNVRARLLRSQRLVRLR